MAINDHSLPDNQSSFSSSINIPEDRVFSEERVTAGPVPELTPLPAKKRKKKSKIAEAIQTAVEALESSVEKGSTKTDSPKKIGKGKKLSISFPKTTGMKNADVNNYFKYLVRRLSSQISGIEESVVSLAPLFTNSSEMHSKGTVLVPINISYNQTFPILRKCYLSKEQSSTALLTADEKAGFICNVRSHCVEILNGIAAAKVMAGEIGGSSNDLNDLIIIALNNLHNLDVDIYIRDFIGKKRNTWHKFEIKFCRNIIGMNHLWYGYDGYGKLYEEIIKPFNLFTQDGVVYKKTSFADGSVGITYSFSDSFILDSILLNGGWDKLYSGCGSKTGVFNVLMCSGCFTLESIGLKLVGERTAQGVTTLRVTLINPGEVVSKKLKEFREFVVANLNARPQNILTNLSAVGIKEHLTPGHLEAMERNIRQNTGLPKICTNVAQDPEKFLVHCHEEDELKQEKIDGVAKYLSIDRKVVVDSLARMVKTCKMDGESVFLKSSSIKTIADKLSPYLT